MLEILGVVGLLAFAVSSISVGVRCLVRGVRSRALPELAVGSGFLVGVLAGYVPESLATSTDLFPPHVASAVLAVTQVAIRFAAVAVMVFTLAVFQRGPLGLALCTAIGLALVASWVAFPHYVHDAASARDRIWYEVFSVSRALAVAWGAVESLRYWRKCARRRRIGLADPLVTERFLLWGIGLVSLTFLMGSTTLAGLVGVDPTAHGWLLLESCLGLVGAVTLWLAFFPTAAYRRWVGRRASGASPIGA